MRDTTSQERPSMNNKFNRPPGEGPGRFIGAVFGFVFLGIGLSVLGFLWLTPFNQFGSPPLFFRVFGSFIAIAFVAMGGGTAYAAIKGTPLDSINSSGVSRQQPRNDSPLRSGGVSDASYSCTNCAAPISGGAEVSPHGDVKCEHCGCWFNVHSS